MNSADHPIIDCPVCVRPLTVLAVGRLLIDVCHEGCGGLWFDHFELQRVDEPHEGEGKLLGAVSRHPEVTRDPQSRLRCPRCRDVVLRRHFFSVKQQVEVDSCPQCGGYWLDHGELERIRSEFSTASARKHATEKFLEELDDEHVNKPCPDALLKANRARSLSAMLKLVGSRYT
ncbi:MAG TPA: zf-TFIIB domain-containing protein [Verrucomicrobiae bacterium]|nr:zf-TFIIB domain-containing protein [Verrucomicrobiae bacterium]